MDHRFPGRGGGPDAAGRDGAGREGAGRDGAGADDAARWAAAPSGRQWEIRRGAQSAVVVEVGGGVRAYTCAGREVLQSYPEDAMCDGAHGAPLIPWPNRLGGGRYRFRGAEHRVPLTEPARGNAIHGLLRWRPFTLLERAADAVTVGAVIAPSPGYPFALEVRIAYRLDDADGLTVATTACNVGAHPLPYAHGQHPYLSAGPGAAADDCVLDFDARTRIRTDPDTALPMGVEPVAGGPYDFRGGRRLGGAVLDDPFTGLGRGPDGRVRVQLTGPDGATAELWAGEGYEYLQLFTGDTLAAGRGRTAVAAEPMTAPPDAFTTGEAVRTVDPGASVTTVWGVRLRR